MRVLRLRLLFFVLAFAQQPAVEPTVRIGLTQNAASVTVKSADLFTVEPDDAIRDVRVVRPT